MKETKIIFNDSYYSSDSIANGRVSKTFIKKLIKNTFAKGDEYFESLKVLTGHDELPLLFDEKNLYSLLSVAIDRITPVHLSEWVFSNEINTKKRRIVDFWCLNKEKPSGKPINYFIEIKKGYYCLTEKSQEDVTKFVSNNLSTLVKQLTSLKMIKPEWNDFDNVYIGLMIVHNYYNLDDIVYDEDDLISSIVKNIDKRHKIQILSGSWIVPEGLPVQWEKNKLKSVTIVGLVLSKTK